MANAQNGNTLYVDSTGSLTSVNTRVAGILFTPAASNDSLVLKDTGTSGPLKLQLQSPTAKLTNYYKFPTPIVFSGGIYVATITSGAVATIITAGAS